MPSIRQFCSKQLQKDMKSSPIQPSGKKKWVAPMKAIGEKDVTQGGSKVMDAMVD